MDAKRRSTSQIGREFDDLPAESDWAHASRYLARTRSLRIRLRSGVNVEIPVRMIEILANASVRERTRLRVEEGGYSIYWPLLDEGLTVPNLVMGAFGTRRWMCELARRGGLAKSPRKAAAARKNGRKGGRPRTKAIVGLRG